MTGPGAVTGVETETDSETSKAPGEAEEQRGEEEEITSGWHGLPQIQI